MPKAGEGRSPIALLALFLAAACATQPAPHDEPDRAAEYFAEKRQGTDDIHRAYDLARERMREMPRYSTEIDALTHPRDVASHATTPRPFSRWTFLGPGNVGGRVRALLIDPVEPHVMYAGGVSGGVWKTTNGGARWTPIGDALQNIAVNSMAMHPDRRTIYAGTGEGYLRESLRGVIHMIRGNGIFITRDAGATWQRLESTNNANFHFVNDLVISTHDPSRVYAATSTGVWRSTNGGESWTRILFSPTTGGCLDLAYRGDTDGDYLYVSCGNWGQAEVRRHPRAETAAQEGAWEAVLVEQLMARTSLAIAPSNPSIIYALAASWEGDTRKRHGLLAVYRSNQNGDVGTWEAVVTNQSEDRKTTLMLGNPLVGMQALCNPLWTDAVVQGGWYHNVIAVDPMNPERVWAGGVDLFRSDDGGRTWGLASYWWAEVDQPSYAHADQHVIAFHPQYDGVTNRTVFFGNDGGVFRTDDALAAVAHQSDAVCDPLYSAMRFVSLNNEFGVTQFYHGAVFPDGRSFIGGTQDNGTILGRNVDGPNAWFRVHGGDGGYVAIDPEDPLRIYAETQNAGFVKSIDGGQTFRSARVGIFDNTLFIAPFVMDPNRTSRLWLGGTRLWRTDNRALNWQQASTAFGGRVSAIAIAPGNSDHVLAATSIGEIARHDSATTARETAAWNVVRPREGFPAALAFDPFDEHIAYVTYAGFGGKHVWKSIDGGTTWTPIDNNLPDIPVHAIAIDPTRPARLYLGTDLGVFASIDGGATWAVENTGFAAAITEAVVIAQGERGPAVYAFTHGRGAWRAELVTASGKRRSAGK